MMKLKADASWYMGLIRHIGETNKNPIEEIRRDILPSATDEQIKMLLDGRARLIGDTEVGIEFERLDKEETRKRPTRKIK